MAIWLFDFAFYFILFFFFFFFFFFCILLGSVGLAITRLSCEITIEHQDARPLSYISTSSLVPGQRRDGVYGPGEVLRELHFAPDQHQVQLRLST